ADLAAQLAADAAAGAGHHHDLAADLRVEQLVIELDRLAAEEVLDRDLANACEADVVADDLVDAGDDLGVETGLAAQHRDATDIGAGRIRDRDQRAFGALAVGDLDELVGRAEDRQAG